MALRRTITVLSRHGSEAGGFSEAMKGRPIADQQNTSLTRELMNARVHMGHRTYLTKKTMYPYILGERNGLHVINLDKTVVMLRRGLGVLKEMVAHNCSVMWCIPNDNEIYKIISPLAEKAGAYLLKGRWVAGTLTNPLATRQALRYGFKLPGCLYVLNTKAHEQAIREAVLLSIPVVAVVDTDTDPRNVTYPIPGNDESIHALHLYANMAMHAMMEGQKLREQRGYVR
eukprot:Plantae.Rhodophyta-Purpureofilum_apyrenoidigerum.ctg22231.p1 GENE.Plantae.Rhodophyta-Purpureofilum_apyrenoidigerum.ctg22231~~Plantae.Rhodophyta-Purpureofilum_apyrenoidigerum.ctg22231.p1  ORF type:complete len:229 (+),score=40.65 Plantae.Rhodophyta-Purpureofilum_apyrenoidigerum.ctg22231:194-880(+)